MGSLHVLAYDYSTGCSFSITENQIIVRELEIHEAGNTENLLDSKLSLIIDLAKKNADLYDLAEDLTVLQKNQPTETASSLAWKSWADDLQKVMIKHLKIGYRYKFSEEGISALKQYLYLANLIVDCIQADIFSSREVREQIIRNLLMPIDLIPENLLLTKHHCSFCM